MIVWLARGLTRLLALVFLPVMAGAALLAAIAAIAGGERSRDAARSLGATDAWRSIDGAIRGGAVDERALLIAGAIALALGLALLVGVFVPRREREIPLTGAAQLGVRPRALRQALRHLAEDVRGVREAKVRIGARRVGSGARVRVRAVRAASIESAQITSGISASIAPVAEAFGAAPRVRSGVASDREGALR